MNEGKDMGELQSVGNMNVLKLRSLTHGSPRLDRIV
jgi:hypothetical protein